MNRLLIAINFYSLYFYRHCYVSFLDYKRCVKLRGDDYAPCQYFKKVYTSLCPFAWVEKWETQLEEGTFAGKI